MKSPEDFLNQHLDEELSQPAAGKAKGNAKSNRAVDAAFRELNASLSAARSHRNKLAAIRRLAKALAPYIDKDDRLVVRLYEAIPDDVDINDADKEIHIGFDSDEIIEPNEHAGTAEKGKLQGKTKPRTNGHGDTGDAGGTREQLDALVEQAPDWQPHESASGENTAQNDALAELLAKYSIVLVGGSARIITWKKRRLYAGEGGEHEVPNLLNADSFRLFHRNKFELIKGPDGKTVRQQLANLFFDRARRYHDLVFVPGAGPEIGNQLNLWRGFGVSPKQGRWPLMRAHMREVMAASNEEQDRYNFRWMAWTVQNPGQQAEVALVFRGLKGTGKGTLGNALCRIFGPHGLQIADRKHLVGSFNMHMSQCAFLFADEAYWPGDKEGEGALKRLITEPTLTIEPKGFDLFTVANNLHVVIAGNEEWIAPASGDERRYAVNEVSSHRRGDRAYFNALYAEMGNGGLAAMLNDLMIANLAGWHPRNDVPQTDGLQKQKALSRRGVDRLVEMIATDGCVPCPHETYPDIAMTTGEGEGKGFYAHAKTIVPDLKFSSSITIATALVDHWSCERWKSGNLRGIKFPDLAKLRATFDTRHGPQKWPPNQRWDAD